MDIVKGLWLYVLVSHVAFVLAAAAVLSLKVRERDMTLLANACEVCFSNQQPIWWQDYPRAYVKQGDYGGCK